MKILFLVLGPMYVLSFVLALSSNYILTVWLGVEVNLISFIGLLNLGKSSSLEMGSMKYFISQALGSMVLVGALFASMTPFSYPNVGLTFVSLSIIFKLGMFPFHWWFLSFIATSNNLEMWFVSVPQKILPIYVLIIWDHQSMVLILSLVFGAVISVISGLKTSRLNLILGYSSLMNSSWFMIFLNNFLVLFTVVSIYGVSLAVLLGSFAEEEGYLGSGLSSEKSWGLSMVQMLSLLNLGGVPPFFNMWMKFFILSELMNSYFFSLLPLFVLGSGGFLYIYCNFGAWSMSFSQVSKLSWSEKAGGAHVMCLFVPSFLLFFF